MLDVADVLPFQTDMLKKSDELEALKEQYNLLRKVLVQKEEVRVGWTRCKLIHPVNFHGLKKLV